MTEASALKEILAEAKAFFLIPRPPDKLYGSLDAAMAMVPSVVRQSFVAFRANVEAVVDTTSSPFTFEFESSVRIIRQRLATLEAIDELGRRSVDEPPVTEHEAGRIRREAQQRVGKTLSEHLGTEPGQQEAIQSTLQSLLAGHREPKMRRLARELLAQGTVALWGCLEVLAKDVLRAAVNDNPTLAKRITEDAQAASHFPLPRFAFADLEAFGFNLAKVLGDQLFLAHDFSDVRRLKAALLALVQNDRALREALGARDLWLLNQARHLIVHRRGVVDEAFLRNTGLELPPGEELPLAPESFTKHVQAVLAVAVALAEAAPSALETSPTATEDIVGATGSESTG